MDIFISGIPKGLDPTSVTEYIKRSVETVAQVNSVWVRSDKGYGVISLFDATSADYVLALNNHMHINGSVLSLQRKHVKRDNKYLKPSDIGNPRCPVQRQCLSPRSDDSYCINAGTSHLSEQRRLGAYITYKSYHRDQPCIETLYSILQHNPSRRKTQKLRRPRKDFSIHTTIPAPAASRKSGRIRKRHRKKRKEPRSLENRGSSQKKLYTSERNITISNTEKDKKKHQNDRIVEQSTAKIISDGTTMKHRSSGENRSLSNSTTTNSFEAECFGHHDERFTQCFHKEKTENGNMLQQSSDNDHREKHCLVNVHFYDHSKYLFSEDIAKNNTKEDLDALIGKRYGLPPGSYMLTHNGKVINNICPPTVEDNENIHIVVKGRGGMKDGDPTGEAQPGNSKTADDIRTAQAPKIAVSNTAEEACDNTKSSTTETEKPCDNTISSTTANTCNSTTTVPKTVTELGLEEYFPGKLKKRNMMCISEDEDRKPETLTDIPWIILRKIIMLDRSARENVLDEYYSRIGGGGGGGGAADDDYDEDEEEYEEEGYDAKLHPLDVFMSIYLCLHPRLQRHVCTKMFMCRLAVPFIYGDPSVDNVLKVSLYPFRDVIIERKDHTKSVINCKQNVISFVRLGRPNFSKSSFANLLLHDNSDRTFFNMDCPLGEVEKNLSKGLVEAAWYIPTGSSDKKELEEVTMVLNLRGDSLKCKQTMTYLNEISKIIIIAADVKMLENDSAVQELGYIRRDVIFLLSDKIPKQNRDSLIDQMKKFIPSQCSVHFISRAEKGKRLGDDTLKSLLIKRLNGCLNAATISHTKEKAYPSAKDRSTLYEICIPEMENIIVDEMSSDLLKKAKKTALDVFNIVETLSSTLQTDIWKQYVQTKRQLQNERKSLVEKEKILQEIKAKAKQSELIKCFIKAIKILQGDELLFFHDFLSFEIDKAMRCSKEPPKSESNPPTDVPNVETETARREAKSDVSLGIEHLFREIGILFELDALLEDDRAMLPKVVARLLFEGVSFELMDGDVNDIPLKWVQAVFKELKYLTENKKVLTLSITGLQSSGKSTLLNALFGVSFPVGVGRCTRGIFTHILPVAKGDFSFDYVLVLDTEGLRAKNSDTNYQRDNELATLAIGMADIAIINIKGENTCEVQNIIQVCIHAFLRLKVANKNLCLSQSCIFTHQNVSSGNVDKELTTERKELEEKLDEMTQQAANLENLDEIQHFTEIIGFHCHTHVFYFTDLWTGEPPKAFINPGYSKKAQNLKTFIFQTLAAKMTANIKTLSDMNVHLSDLWEGILTHNFLLSFRNTLEYNAYNSLENGLAKVTLQLERYVDTMVYNSKLTFEDLLSDKELQKSYKGLVATNNSKLKNKADILKCSLDENLKKEEYKQSINKWKDHLMQIWNITLQKAELTLKEGVDRMYNRYSGMLTIHRSLGGVRKDLTDFVTQNDDYLRSSPSGKTTVYSRIPDIKDHFNRIWEKHVGDMHIPEEVTPDIKLLLTNILRIEFQEEKKKFEDERSSHQYDFTKYTCISDAVELFILDAKLFKHKFDMNKPMWGNMLSIGVKMGVLEKCKGPVQKAVKRFTKQLLRYVDMRFEDFHHQDISQFTGTEMTSLITELVGKVKTYNDTNEIGVCLKGLYTIRLAVFVCDFACPRLQELDNKYRGIHSIQAQLDRARNEEFDRFQHQTFQKTMFGTAKIVCVILCPHIDDYIRRKLYHTLYRDTAEEVSSKKALLVKIMRDLVENQANRFDRYIEYIQNPHTYALEWLQRFVNDRCFTEQYRLYFNMASNIIDEVVSHIKKVIDEIKVQNVNEWLAEFHRKLQSIIPVPTYHSECFGDQMDFDVLVFSETLMKEIDKKLNEMKANFNAVDKDTVVWPDNKQPPYKKVMDNIWGCERLCPFCHEPCTLGKDHKPLLLHKCIQHRPMGINGTFWMKLGKLSNESCNIEVGLHKNVFDSDSGSQQKLQSSIMIRLKEFFGSKRYRRYKNYKDFYPDWNIVPSSDASLSTYWAWVLCQYNDQFAAHYGKQPTDIPLSWKRITKQDALNSLPDPKAPE